MRANPTKGFSLIELLVTLAVLATVLAIALPSFADLLHRIYVTTAAETLYADLQLARAEAIKRNQTIFLVFGNIGRTDWCYGLDDQRDGCDCTRADIGIGTGNCEVGNGANAFSKVVRTTDHDPALRLQKANFSGLSHTLFDEIRGTASPGTALLHGHGFQVGIKVSGLGRIRLCRAPESKAIGYRSDATCRG